MVKKANKSEKSCCNWSGKEWLMAAVSEAALYGFFYYLLMYLGAGSAVQALVLWVLINVMFFTCPCMAKHMCK